MTKTTMEQDVDQVCTLIERSMRDGERTIIGIAGPPASGKSTLAEAVVQSLNSGSRSSVARASLLPMDGYHLDNRLLESRGLLARKGAPETFDASGFCDAVGRLAEVNRETYHPKFDRHLDLAIANAIAIHPETPVVVVEGNYLLLDRAPWSSLRALFAATVFVCPSMQALRERLLQRWIKHGLEPDAALRKTIENDLPNAELVARESHLADLMLTQDYTEFGVRYAY
ncbi:nucleoside triphosphate hydrolase [Roseibium sediminicola]|uniref:Nucleoside triphosphate hydrolase n=1 Tax=Roseibium sediminicola TaxID=2933272 RepID=A0ABT0GNA7_9HYPH|nr:nucleoside triphosphate hydrolase [Roseibium sp. CAU 1639]MCK7610898.1 nucleoside triphosphate hydrolase [Roseibium sp. CAU 1639]